MVLTNYTFWKHLLHGFKLWLISCEPVTNKTCTSRGVFSGGLPPPPFPLGHGTKQIIKNYVIELRNQIIIKYACGRGLRYLAFLHHFNQLESRSGADFRFFGRLLAKILALWKAFFNLNLQHSTLGKKDIAPIFFISAGEDVRKLRAGVQGCRIVGRAKGQLFQWSLSILLVQSLPPTLLSNALKQLNTSTKREYWVQQTNQQINSNKRNQQLL